MLLGWEEKVASRARVNPKLGVIQVTTGICKENRYCPVWPKGKKQRLIKSRISVQFYYVEAAALAFSERVKTGISGDESDFEYW